MEDLIAQLNADKNYFEKELIDMQMKQDDMLEELKRKDKEIYELQKVREEIEINFSGQEDKIRSLQSGKSNNFRSNSAD